MIVTNLEEFDITGSDPKYKRTDLQFMIFTGNQKIVFGEPVFADSIKIKNISTDPATQLVAGVDFIWNQTSAAKQVCQDFTSEAKAKVLADRQGKTFNKTIVSAVLLTAPAISAQFKVSIEYQSFEKHITNFDRDSYGPDYSPGMTRAIIDELAELKSKYSEIKDVTTEISSTSAIICMPQDLTGAAATNYVENEQHYVNVPNDKFVARLLNGSFYKHDLSLKLVSQSAIINLVEGTDYEVIGLNSAKTSISQPSSGVYEYIVFKSAIVGNVNISYHAFGGEVSQSDINELKKRITNIEQKISADTPLTPETLKDTAIIKDIVYRIDLLEKTVRHYQCETFKYQTTVASQNGVYKGYYNWCNLAFIQKDVWMKSADIPLVGDGHFTIEFETSNKKRVSVELYLTYNLYETTNKKLSIQATCVSSIDYKKDGLDYFNGCMFPKFRLIYNKVTEGTYETVNDGIMLQMSVNGYTSQLANVKIWDKSNAKSYWTLISSQGAIRPDSSCSEGSVLFPNGKIWSTSKGGKQTNYQTIFPNDYVIFDGYLPIDDKMKDYVFQPLIQAFDWNKSYEVPSFKAFKYVIYDRTQGKDIQGLGLIVKSKHEPTQETIWVSKKPGSIISFPVLQLQDNILFYNDDMCALSVTYQDYKNTNQKSKSNITFIPQIGSQSLESERFVLKQVALIK